MHRTIGTDGEWARHYPRPLAEAGLIELGLKVTIEPVGCDTATDIFVRNTLDQITPTALAAGAVTEQQVRHFRASLNDPRHLELFLAFVTAWGQPPG